MSNSKAKPQNAGTRVLFKNKILERLSRTHISVPLIIMWIFSAAMIYWALAETTLSVASVFLFYLVGLLCFTFIEYLVHRYIFHMKTDTPRKEKIQYTFHGVHHEYPKDKDRLAMPPVLSATISIILLFIFKLIMGNYAFAFLPGFLVGYSLYLLVHYSVHAYQPPKNILKILWVHHGIHHYKNNKVAYGVSSPLWDVVFKTMPK